MKSLLAAAALILTVSTPAIATDRYESLPNPGHINPDPRSGNENCIDPHSMNCGGDADPT